MTAHQLQLRRWCAPSELFLPLLVGDMIVLAPFQPSVAISGRLTGESGQLLRRCCTDIHWRRRNTMRTCHLRRTNRTCRHGSWQRRKTTAVGVKARTCCCLRPALKKLLSDGESSRWRRRRAAPPALDAPAADPPTASMCESSSLLTVLCSSESIGTLQLAQR